MNSLHPDNVYIIAEAGVNHNGQIVWVNTAAHSLLKLPFEIAVNTIRVEEVFDLSTADFFDLTGKDTSIQRLSNGFSVYLQTQYSFALVLSSGRVA